MGSNRWRDIKPQTSGGARAHTTLAAMLAAASKLAAAAFQQANPQLPACAGRGILITIVSDTM